MQASYLCHVVKFVTLHRISVTLGVTRERHVRTVTRHSKPVENDDTFCFDGDDKIVSVKQCLFCLTVRTCCARVNIKVAKILWRVTF